MDPDVVGIVSGVGRDMGVLDGGRDLQSGRGSFGVNWGCPIVINEDFVTRLFRITLGNTG